MEEEQSQIIAALIKNSSMIVHKSWESPTRGYIHLIYELPRCPEPVPSPVSSCVTEMIIPMQLRHGRTHIHQCFSWKPHLKWPQFATHIYIVCFFCIFHLPFQNVVTLILVMIWPDQTPGHGYCGNVNNEGHTSELADFTQRDILGLGTKEYFKRKWCFVLISHWWIPWCFGTICVHGWK